jgi:hypothetical protein
MTSKIFDEMIPAESLIKQRPNIIHFERIDKRLMGSGIWGHTTRNLLDLSRRSSPLELSGNDLQELQEQLLQRSLKDGTDAWHLNLEGGYTDMHLQCPVCGGENLHQEEVVAGNIREGVAIAYQCETCPAEPHLQMTQHKGISSIFWNAKQLLEDFGAYDAALALISSNQYKRSQELKAKSPHLAEYF